VTNRQPDPAPGAEPERGFVLAAPPKGSDVGAELAELRELARTAGVDPVAELVQQRARPDPRTYVGKGKLTELKEAFPQSGAESLIVDDELSPTQQRQLEDALQARVVDRTQLILDIFAQHAVSAEGKLQVELAQLEYNLPRMRGLWQHLERLGGGLGTRGPGESQLETDRRLARRRVIPAGCVGNRCSTTAPRHVELGLRPGPVEADSRLGLQVAAPDPDACCLGLLDLGRCWRCGTVEASYQRNTSSPAGLLRVWPERAALNSATSLSSFLMCWSRDRMAHSRLSSTGP